MSDNGSRASGSPEDQLRQILRAARVIAVVGLSNDPSRPSYGVSRYLQHQDYKIVPVNPEVSEVLGEQAYPDIRSVPFTVDLVDIFRRSAFVAAHIDEAITQGVPTIWLQLGVHDAAAEARAQNAGLTVITDRCIAVEHRRLLN